MSDFKLIRPCANCPFRTDLPVGYLRKDRAAEIAHSLASGAVFQCHKTTDLDDEYDGGFYEEHGGGEQFCAGALIMLEKMEQPNQIMRIAERTGQYDPERLDMSAPVVSDTVTFMHLHGEGEEEHDPCSVCGPYCLAPAGYMVGGTVVPATVDPDDMLWCEGCGEAVCTACSTDEFCDFCAEDE